jgi:hypothetical protein
MSAGRMSRSPDGARYPAVGLGEALKANSTASLEYIRVEENRQRNTVQPLPMERTDPVTEGRSRILHNGWCNSKKVYQFG